MRRSIKSGRRLVLAVSASVLLAGSALAAANLPALAAGASAGRVATAAQPDLTPPPPTTTVTVATPGATTESVGTAVDLPLSATDSAGAAGYPLKWSASTNLASLGLAVGATNVDGTEAAITGTATGLPGTYPITLTATDHQAVPEAGSATFDLTLTDAANTVTVTNPGAQTSPVGIAITPLPIVATDSDLKATLTYTATGLPTGLAIDEATGVISGKPTVAKAYDVTVTVTDGTGATGAAAFAWTVGKPNTIAVTAPANKTVWEGIAASVKVTATDSEAGQTLTWSAAGLPPGLTINQATGVISGRATKLLGFTSHVTATDGTGATATAIIKWYVAPAVVIPNVGTQTTNVGQWLTMSPFTYKEYVPGDKPSFSATGLPAGMSFLTSPKLIYGWPNATGIYQVTIHEHGSLGSTDAMTFKLVVKSAAIGGAGQIHLPLAGKCLADPGSRTASNVHVVLANCASGAAESWNIGTDNTIRVYGRCLTIAGNGSAAGRQLEISGCTDGTRQRWAEGSRGELVNPASALCVTDPGSSKRNGTVPTMGSCRVSANEQWTLPAQRVLTALGGSCLDTSSNGAIGQRIDMFWCKYSGSYWTFEPDGTIRMFGDKCVTIKNKKAVIGLCSGGNSSQHWTVARTSAMGSELTEGGVCLAIPGMSAANDSQLLVSKCSPTDPRDLWHIQ